MTIFISIDYDEGDQDTYRAVDVSYGPSDGRMVKRFANADPVVDFGFAVNWAHALSLATDEQVMLLSSCDHFTQDGGRYGWRIDEVGHEVLCDMDRVPERLPLDGSPDGFKIALTLAGSDKLNMKFVETIVDLYFALEMRHKCSECGGKGIHWIFANGEAEPEPCQCLLVAKDALLRADKYMATVYDLFLINMGYDPEEIGNRTRELADKLIEKMRDGGSDDSSG